MFLFDIESYRIYGDNVCMHCSTEEDAREFLLFLDGLGLAWRSGDSYLSRTNFDTYGSGSCYYFTEGTYGNIGNAREREDIILEYSDFVIDTDFADDVSEELDAFLGAFYCSGKTLST